MKALFLAALIIAFASAQVSVPSGLFGNWNFANSTCNGPCVQHMDFVQTGANSLDATVTFFNTAFCGNGTSITFEASNFVVNTTLPSNPISNFTLTFEDSEVESDAEFSFLDVNGTTALITIQPGSNCFTTYTKSANLLKATIAAVIAAVMLI